MAEETAEGAEEGLEGDGGSKRLSGKKIVLFIVLPLLLLIGAGVGVTIVLGVFDAPEEVVEEGAETLEPEPEPIATQEAVFFNIPDMIVNLNTSGRNSTFLKIKVELEVDQSADLEEMDKLMPRIVDQFQIYLRELRPEDLQGSDGLYRLREELLRRVNYSVQPIRVKGLLFKEILIQ